MIREARALLRDEAKTANSRELAAFVFTSMICEAK